MDATQFGWPSTARRKPPAQIHLRWCPTCDRTDRVERLGDRHFTGGKRCSGTPKSLVYDLRGEA